MDYTFRDLMNELQSFSERRLDKKIEVRDRFLGLTYTVDSLDNITLIFKDGDDIVEEFDKTPPPKPLEELY